MSASAYVSTVASDPGFKLVEQLNRFDEQHRRRSTASGSDRMALESTLVSLYHECCEPNWDGEGSLPVSLNTLLVAQRFVRALPADAPKPGMSCAPDGSIEFDWMPTRGRIVSVSIHESDRIAFAWLNGTERGHAVVRFTGSVIPSQLLYTIKEIGEVAHARIRST